MSVTLLQSPQTDADRAGLLREEIHELEARLVVTLDKRFVPMPTPEAMERQAQEMRLSKPASREALHHWGWAHLVGAGVIGAVFGWFFADALLVAGVSQLMVAAGFAGIFGLVTWAVRLPWAAYGKAYLLETLPQIRRSFSAALTWTLLVVAVDLAASYFVVHKAMENSTLGDELPLAIILAVAAVTTTLQIAGAFIGYHKGRLEVIEGAYLKRLRETDGPSLVALIKKAKNLADLERHMARLEAQQRVHDAEMRALPASNPHRNGRG